MTTLFLQCDQCLHETPLHVPLNSHPKLINAWVQLHNTLPGYSNIAFVAMTKMPWITSSNAKNLATNLSTGSLISPRSQAYQLFSNNTSYNMLLSSIPHNSVFYNGLMYGRIAPRELVTKTLTTTYYNTSCYKSL